MNITLDSKEIRAEHRVYKTEEWLTISVPNGWDDVKKIHNKVLTYDGKKFLFTGWNSDRNECFFKTPVKNSPIVVAKLE